jgi:hypothetical protein
MAQTTDHTTPPLDGASKKVLTRKEKIMFWFKRVGWAGFLFFLIKGIVWLVIFWLGAEAVTS